MKGKPHIPHFWVNIKQAVGEKEYFCKKAFFVCSDFANRSHVGATEIRVMIGIWMLPTPIAEKMSFACLPVCKFAKTNTISKYKYNGWENLVWLVWSSHWSKWGSAGFCCWERMVVNWIYLLFNNTFPVSFKTYFSDSLNCIALIFLLSCCLLLRKDWLVHLHLAPMDYCKLYFLDFCRNIFLRFFQVYFSGVVAKG